MDILGTKDPSLRNLVEEIARRVPAGCFIVVDHWESDPFAIGLARPTSHDHLVYISSERDVHGRWYLSRETPREHDLEQYHEAGTDQFDDIESLAAAVAGHLCAA